MPRTGLVAWELANKDEGHDPNKFETGLLRHRLANGLTLTKLVEPIDETPLALSDSALYVATLVKPPVLAAYEIAKPLAKNGKNLNPATNYFGAVARAGVKTRKAKAKRTTRSWRSPARHHQPWLPRSTGLLLGLPSDHQTVLQHHPKPVPFAAQRTVLVRPLRLCLHHDLVLIGGCPESLDQHHLGLALPDLAANDPERVVEPEAGHQGSVTLLLCRLGGLSDGRALPLLFDRAPLRGSGREDPGGDDAGDGEENGRDERVERRVAHESRENHWSSKAISPPPSLFIFAFSIRRRRGAMG